jgi:hypothetical protein
MQKQLAMAKCGIICIEENFVLKSQLPFFIFILGRTFYGFQVLLATMRLFIADGDAHCCQTNECKR